MVYLCLPTGRIALNGRLFFLGAGFMLLETKAVVQLALLFGQHLADEVGGILQRLGFDPHSRPIPI
jgi:hypothetical protein